MCALLTKCVIAGEENGRTNKLKLLDKEVDSHSDVGHEDEVDKTVFESRVMSPSRQESQSNVPGPTNEVPPERRVIRFADGDPENPDNWPRVSYSLSFCGCGVDTLTLIS